LTPARGKVNVRSVTGKRTTEEKDTQAYHKKKHSRGTVFTKDPETRREGREKGRKDT